MSDAEGQPAVGTYVETKRFGLRGRVARSYRTVHDANVTRDWLTRQHALSPEDLGGPWFRVVLENDLVALVPLRDLIHPVPDFVLPGNNARRYWPEAT